MFIPSWVLLIVIIVVGLVIFMNDKGAELGKKLLKLIGFSFLLYAALQILYILIGLFIVHPEYLIQLIDGIIMLIVLVTLVKKYFT